MNYSNADLLKWNILEDGLDYSILVMFKESKQIYRSVLGQLGLFCLIRVIWFLSPKS